MKVLIFKSAASHGLGYQSGFPVEVKDDKTAQKYIDDKIAVLATAKEIKENAASKSAAKKETASK